MKARQSGAFETNVERASRETTCYLPQGNETRLFEHAWRHQIPVLLKGPTGCGKSRLVTHMAEKLQRPLFTVPCHEDLSAADLLGRHLIGADGTYWQDGPLTRAVREGGICYLDEVVEARNDSVVVIHPLSDDRRTLFIDKTGERIKASADFMLVVSYNPGYQNWFKGMKPSTRQRFLAIRLDHPAVVLEARILIAETAVDAELAQRLAGLGQRLRRLKDHDLDEAPSTRLLIHAARLIRQGVPEDEALQAAVIEPLSDDVSVVESLMAVVHATF